MDYIQDIHSLLRALFSFLPAGLELFAQLFQAVGQGVDEVARLFFTHALHVSILQKKSDS